MLAFPGAGRTFDGMRTALLALSLSLLLPACQGRRLLTGAAPEGGGGSGAWGSTAGRAGEVRLSPRDLQPVDAYISAGSQQKNTRWIVGDDVVVEASREYFGSAISISARQGAVTRTDEPHPDETLTTLTFTMGKYQAAVENNPRVTIGTGITVSARRTLKVRLFRTRDADHPVQLRITSTGDASRGRHEVVEQRGDTLQIGGTLVRSAAGWAWTPIG